MSALQTVEMKSENIHPTGSAQARNLKQPDIPFQIY